MRVTQVVIAERHNKPAKEERMEPICASLEQSNDPENFMSDHFTLIPLRDAVASLGLDRHFEDRTTLDGFDSEKDSVRHYAGDAVISSDLDMDALAGEEIAGIVVDGDLDLDGSIMNWEIDTIAAFLWVRGNLRCRNIVFGCMDLVVSRHVTASGLIVATYNHGHLLINGDVSADRVIIDDDGSSIIGGRVQAKGWNASNNAEVDMRSSEWIEEVRPEFRDEFFRENGFFKCGDGNVDLVKALLAGRDILRDEKAPAAR